MINKWFFQKQFCDFDLCQIAATSCSLQYPRLGCDNENRIITIPYLNPNFFQLSEWAQFRSGAYEPFTNFPKDIVIKGPYTPAAGYTPNFGTGETAYYNSVNRDKGWFSKQVLTATSIEQGGEKRQPLPMLYGRYNPAEDNGKGNEVWLCSVTGDQYHKPSDAVLVLTIHHYG